MGHPTKVQLIQRKNGPGQWYVNFPTAVAQAMEFNKGETVEWVIEDKANVILHRRQVPASPGTSRPPRRVPTLTLWVSNCLSAFGKKYAPPIG